MKLLLEPPHPVTVIPPMDSDMKNVIDAQGDRKTQHDLRETRLAAVRHWRQRAHDLRETSLAIINDLQDEPLRNHHLKGDATKTKLGEFTHVALWKEMCETVQHTDTSFIEGLVSGFPVVGRVQRSHIFAARSGVRPAHLHVEGFRTHGLGCAATGCAQGARVSGRRSLGHVVARHAPGPRFRQRPGLWFPGGRTGTAIAHLAARSGVRPAHLHVEGFRTRGLKCATTICAQGARVSGRRSLGHVVARHAPGPAISAAPRAPSTRTATWQRQWAPPRCSPCRPSL